MSDRLGKVLRDWQEDVADLDVLLDSYASGTDPAEIVEDKERLGDLMAQVVDSLESLDMEDREIFCLYIFDGYSLRKIETVTGLKKSTVWDKLQKIFTMLRLDAEDTGHSTVSTGIKRETLRASSVRNRHENSHHVGFPFELARNLGTGGCWTLVDGYKTYKSLKECRLREYIDESFGKDPQVACPICRRCKGGEKHTPICESGTQDPA